MKFDETRLIGERETMFWLSHSVNSLWHVLIFWILATQACLGIINPQTNVNHSSVEALDQTVRHWGYHQSFPYWRNIGQIDRSSGVYMGKGNVLTAAHVGPGRFRTTDGRSYPPVAGSAHYFKNFDGSQSDLCLFAIHIRRGDPIAKLPQIPITTKPPQQGMRLVLLGSGAGGRARGKRFQWNDDYHVRWGLNTIEEIYAVPMPTSRYSSFGFSTRFDRRGLDCQAAPGDSGGAAFCFNESLKRWELAGIIVAVDSKYGVAEYGNQTYIADPALFRSKFTEERLLKRVIKETREVRGKRGDSR